MKSFLTITCSLLLAMIFVGCSMALPVKEHGQSSDETFSGTATGFMDGGGNLGIVSSKGAVCTGDFFT